jgi:hypothetical protein
MNEVLRLLAQMTGEVLGAPLCAQHQSQQRCLLHNLFFSS